MSDVLERPRAPYRDDLCRSVPFRLVRAEDEEDGDGLTIDGYGAVFHSVTVIDSWEGVFEEEILPGAFRKSLRERTPRMQFDHGRHPLLGSLPLGRWHVAEEDQEGLHGVGRLSDNWLIQPFRDAIRDEAVDSMSFRFSVVREEWVDKDGKKIRDEELPDLLWYGAGDRGPIRRRLKELRVSEFGPVTWPAYEATSVGVRSVGERFVVDLGRLDLRTARARSELARAVALADAAASTSTPVPRTAGRDWARPAQTPDAAPAAPVARPEPRSTAAPAADEHPAAPAAPLDTADVAAGEHSSAKERRDRMRAGTSRIRGVMATIDQKG